MAAPPLPRTPALTTARPLLTARECERVLAAVDAHVRDALGAGLLTEFYCPARRARVLRAAPR